MPYDYEDDDYYPEDEIEPDDEECSDPNCETCHPREEDEIVLESPASGLWTFNSTHTSSAPVSFSADIGRVQESFERISEILRDTTEGEEVPETPEVTPEQTPEENAENTGPVRPAPVPTIRGVTFTNRRGTTLRQDRPENGVTSGCTAQISFWDITPAETRQAFRELKEWLTENQFHMGGVSKDYFQDENDCQGHIIYYFSIWEIGTNGTTDPVETISQPPCSCGAELDYPTFKCPECDALTYCTSCRDFRANVQFDSNYGSHCEICGVICEECESRFNARWGECNTCFPRVNCRNCSMVLYVGRSEILTHEFQGTEYSYCRDCYDGICHSCGMVVDPEHIIEDEGHACTNCVSRNNSEEWDESESESLLIPTIPGREVIRLVGVEIEGANGEGMAGRDGGNTLARALYDAGLSGSYAMNGYHSGTRSKVYVERDSSVDWEMVVGPLNIADPTDVDLLNSSVRVVRGFINDKTLKLDMRAGMHVHVGAEKVPFHNAYNLHKLYMYMEDFLYRLGAAKWPYHRSVNRRGRDQAGKSPEASGKLNFARTFSGQRYYGLSFDNYFARYFEQCGCGARTYGLFDECTCDLGKCTFEFRLFNTTANTVKIHAYLAICQALVAKAIELDEITNEREYPALDFVKSKVPDMHHRTRTKYIREWEKRIVFVNEQLPLTPEEKRSIHYCIMNSELGKVVTNADILLETEEN